MRKRDDYRKRLREQEELVYKVCQYLFSFFIWLLVVFSFLIILRSVVSKEANDQLPNTSQHTVPSANEAPREPYTGLPLAEKQNREVKITIHSEDIIVNEKETAEKPKEEPIEIFLYNGDVLTASRGRVKGPSGEETWYNLDMSGVISNMRALGFSETEYPYWIRGDGVKMLGNYAMIAANLDIRSKGSIVETSLGPGLVCDTGSFAHTNQTQIDIATNW